MSPRWLVLPAVLSLTAGWPGEARGQVLPEADPAAQRRLSIQPRLLELKRQAATRPSGPGPFVVSQFECLSEGDARNLNLDCDSRIEPKNEPHLVVDPTDPLHMVASANDYESCCDEFFTTFDGGRSWFTGDMSIEDGRRIGSDPVSSFDPKHGRVLHASLNFLVTPLGFAHDGDIAVSPSDDGGVTWGDPVVAAPGSDTPGARVFNDKDWMATDVNPSSPFYGRTYLTWTSFRAGPMSRTIFPIYEAHSSDGGRTWSAPQEISGKSARFCTVHNYPGPSGRCDQDQFSSIAIAPDGTVYVAFENFQNKAAWEPGESGEAQYLVVRSTNGGRTFSDPVHVVDLEDGSRDFPVNVFGEQTLTGFQLRMGSSGNLVAHPRTGKLFLVFADNRAGVHDVAHPVTDVNVFLMTSSDGVSWNGPITVSDAPSDQWFPTADVSPATGDLAVLYDDRSVASSSDLYGVTLARGGPGSFERNAISKFSDPVHSLWFRAGARDCPRCATFNGDYIGLAFGSDGAANLVWTQMSRFLDLPSRAGFDEDIFFSRR